MSARCRMPYWRFLTIVFVLLQILDGLLTSVGMYRYGLELEANPFAATSFSNFGIYQMALLWKVFSCLIFFGLLWYCRNIGWSFWDAFARLRGKTPKGKTYSMACFHVAGTLMVLVTCYAVGGWLYILIYLR